MISGFGFKKFPDSQHQLFVTSSVIRERGMKKKMRGIVALCVALTIGWCIVAVLAQKADRRQEGSQAHQGRAGRHRHAGHRRRHRRRRVAGPHRPTLAVTWDSNHFFRAPDGSTYMPFTVTVDKSKITSPTAALYVRVANKGGRRPQRRPRARTRTRTPADSSLGEVRLRDGRSRRQAVARYIQVKPGDYDLFVAVKDKGTVEKADKNYTPQSRRAEEGPHRSGLQQGGARRRAACCSRRRFSRPPAGRRPMTIRTSSARCRSFRRRTASTRRPIRSSVVYWVYGATGDATGKPDLTVENSFNQKTADGEKFFNKTQPQALNSQSPYNVSAGRPEFPRGAARQFRAGRLPAGNQDYGQAVRQDRYAERQFHGAGVLRRKM